MFVTRESLLRELFTVQGVKQTSPLVASMCAFVVDIEECQSMLQNIEQYLKNERLQNSCILRFCDGWESYVFYAAISIPESMWLLGCCSLAVQRP